MPFMPRPVSDRSPVTVEVQLSPELYDRLTGAAAPAALSVAQFIEQYLEWSIKEGQFSTSKPRKKKVVK